MSVTAPIRSDWSQKPQFKSSTWRQWAKYSCHYMLPLSLCVSRKLDLKLSGTRTEVRCFHVECGHPVKWLVAYLPCHKPALLWTFEACTSFSVISLNASMKGTGLYKWWWNLSFHSCKAFLLLLSLYWPTSPSKDTAFLNIVNNVCSQARITYLNDRGVTIKSIDAEKNWMGI